MFTQEITLDPTKEWGLILYTDGGARPNPGNIGWGLHGYLYEVQVQAPADHKPVLLKNTFGDVTRYAITTQKGYVEVTKDHLPVLKQKDPIVPATVQYYLDFCGVSDDVGTNNQAEMRAYLQALLIARALPLKELKIWSDSQIVLDGVDKRARNPNWKPNPNYPPPANMELWGQIMEVFREQVAKGLFIEQTWIKGHRGSMGNTHSDWLATIGVFRAKFGQTSSDVLVSAPRKYMEPDVERHPYLNFKRIYFNRVEGYSTPGVYYMADPGSVDEHIGKRTPDSGYGVIQMKTPDPLVEMVRSRQFDTDQDMNAIMMLKMDRLFSKDVVHYLRNFGKYALIPPAAKVANTNLLFLDESVVTVERDPMGQMLRTLDALDFLETLLEKVNARLDVTVTVGDVTLVKESLVAVPPVWGEEQTTDPLQIAVHPITDVFYDKVMKKVGKEDVQKWVFKSQYAPGYRDHLLEVEENVRGTMTHVKIPVILGLDMPPRNNLKQLESERPEVWLITWRESENALRYATVIRSDAGSGIWANYHANRVFFAAPSTS